jgi:C4-dicarboxylate transporter DctQ subunit
MIIKKYYDYIVDGMALLASLMLVWLMVSIIISVFLRNLGLQPSAWFFVSTEYSIFYMTLLGAPWLVREKGHVHIELLTAALPAYWLNIVSRLVSLICMLVCLILAWKGLELMITNVERSDYDVRAFFVPKWLLTIAFPFSFSVMAIEFAQFVFGKDILHSGEAGVNE